MFKRIIDALFHFGERWNVIIGPCFYCGRNSGRSEYLRDVRRWRVGCTNGECRFHTSEHRFERTAIRAFNEGRAKVKDLRMTLQAHIEKGAVE